MSVAEQIRGGEPVERIAASLNALDHAGRLKEIYQLTRDDQAKLFEQAHGRATRLTGNFIPAGTGALTEIIHWGWNTLPVHRKFQKRFTWPNFKREPPHVFGYNEQTLKLFSGPGYFIAHEQPLDGIQTVVIDYTLLPNQKLPHWPRIILNTQRLSRWIYNGTQDWMWQVSDHVTIGRASRGGKWMDNWFVLCREERRG